MPFSKNKNYIHVYNLRSKTLAYVLLHFPVYK